MQDGTSSYQEVFQAESFKIWVLWNFTSDDTSGVLVVARVVECGFWWLVMIVENHVYVYISHDICSSSWVTSQIPLVVLVVEKNMKTLHESRLQKKFTFAEIIVTPPQNKHGTWKWTLGKGDSNFRNQSFPGSMLKFGGCIFNIPCFESLLVWNHMGEFRPLLPATLGPEKFSETRPFVGFAMRWMGKAFPSFVRQGGTFFFFWELDLWKKRQAW